MDRSPAEMHPRWKTFLPAAGRDWLLPLYDPFTRLMGVETSHRRLVEQAAMAAGGRVLEIGCGTGNLSILTKRLNPGVEVVGLDPDPKALALARRKAQRRRAAILFATGFSQELPYPDASFDRVLSSFMLHHVHPEAKPATLQEAVRVLAPRGTLHLADFEQREGPSGGLHGFLARRLHSRHGSSPHDTVLGLMRDAGFVNCEEVGRQSTILGRIVYYKGVRGN
jgi:ubiquinone/menaquinone biosynthesis C-methylase UbiE